MSPSSTHPAPEVIAITAPNRPTISWGSVVAGMFTAIAVQIALAELCISCGLAMYSPFDSAGFRDDCHHHYRCVVDLLAYCLVSWWLGSWPARSLSFAYDRSSAWRTGVGDRCRGRSGARCHDAGDDCWWHDELGW